MTNPRNKTILLIDDDPIANIITTRIIKKKYPYEVMTFTNAIYALDQLKEWVASTPVVFPSLIFLDINMPHMDGWEFLEEYQKLPNALLEKCTVILLTSSLDSDHLQKWKTYRSVQDFISKPLTADKLGVLSHISD